jgi:SAM-dependent methyltransferase
VCAWDFSEVAVRRVRERAEERELPILAEVRDVVARPPEPESFDVVVVARFLERSLAPALMDSLRPGGLLFYQTYAGPRIAELGPRNPAYRLRDNELLWMFRRLRVRFYRDEQGAGDTRCGLRGEAMLVAQRVV